MATAVSFLICVFSALNVVLADADCTSPLETGPCRASIIRYGVNPETNNCESFVYGGCGGNKNNYDSQSECEANCPPDCSSAFDSGPCLAAMPRFGYNPDSGQCEQFTYGGCPGNRNRYQTIDDCNNKCLCNNKK